MIRYFTGDITEGLDPAPGLSGRTTPRMKRIIGRHGDIPRVKGLFVVPSQVQGVLERIGDLGRFQLVIDRPGNQDTIAIRVEHGGAAADRPGLAQQATAALKEGIRLTCDVELIDPGTLADDAPTVDDRRKL